MNPNGSEVLSLTVLTLLKLWHPYIPFITEELSHMICQDISLIESPWPVLPFHVDTQLDKRMQMLYDVIRSVRKSRAEAGVKPGDTVNCFIKATPSKVAIIQENLHIVK